MSRSYKKVPGWSGSARCTKSIKRTATKAVRHSRDVPDGGAYKRCYCSWSIRDWNWRFYTGSELRRYCERWDEPEHKAKMK